MKLVKLEGTKCSKCDILDEILENRNIKVDKKVNVEQDPTLAINLGVMGVPVLVAYSDEDEVIAMVNGIDNNKLNEFFDNLNIG